MAFGVIAGGGTGDSVGTGVGTDGSGNSYVTGYFSGTVDFDPGTGTEELVAIGYQDYFAAKYDASGDLAWVTQAGSSDQQQQGLGIAVDGSGNSYATGYFSGTVDFDPGTEEVQLISTGFGDHFVAKYDASGDLAWVTHAGTSDGYEYGLGIAVGGSGNSYVTGSFRGMVDFDPGTGTAELVAIYEDHFVAKYDTSGDLAWVTHAGSSG